MSDVPVQELPVFQQYQLAFTAHIRHPQRNPKPAKVAGRRMRVYNDIVFNNLLSSVSACYPVLQKVLGKRKWQLLVRSFFAEYRAASPYFRDIPKQFLDYLFTLPDLPVYAQSLAHYEWMELEISAAEVDMPECHENADLLEYKPVLAPALAVLHYHYPVQRISPRYKPSEEEPVDLLVFRNPQDDVRFIELNAASAMLLQLLQPGELTGREALSEVQKRLKFGQSEALFAYGGQLLQELREQGAILGARI